MAMIQVPITKGKTSLEVNSDDFPTEVWNEIVLQGLKVVLNRGTSKITKEAYPDAEEMKAAALAKANEQLQLAKDGKTKLSGASKVKKASGAVMTEARRIARNLVKDAIKAAGHKISHYEASEITAAANAYIDKDPSILEMAKAAIEEREKKPAAIDIMSMVKESPKLVAKAEEKKAKAKADGTLSKTQAGKVAQRKKGDQPASQATH